MAAGSHLEPFLVCRPKPMAPYLGHETRSLALNLRRQAPSSASAPASYSAGPVPYSAPSSTIAPTTLEANAPNLARPSTVPWRKGSHKGLLHTETQRDSLMFMTIQCFFPPF